LQPPERLFEHLQAQLAAAAVGADLGHEEDPVPAPLQSSPEPVFRLPVPVLPAVVKEGDARIHGLVDEADGLVDRLEVSQMMAANAEDGDLRAGSSPPPPRDLPGAAADDEHR